MSRQKRHGKINIRYHDLKQQYSRATDEERARLEEEMDNLNLSYLTGNKALDITLTQKSALCGQAGIQLVCSADSSCLEDMKHYHIYSLLGNALDNAIECLTQVNDASKRVITLTSAAAVTWRSSACRTTPPHRRRCGTALSSKPSRIPRSMATA